MKKAERLASETERMVLLFYSELDRLQKLKDKIDLLIDRNESLENSIRYEDPAWHHKISDIKACDQCLRDASFELAGLPSTYETLIHHLEGGQEALLSLASR